MESRATEQEHSAPESAEAPARVAEAGPAARMLGLQRTIGNRRTAALVAGAPTRQIARYKIMGPWNSGQAIHETLRLLAIKQAKEKLIAKGEDPGYLLWGFGTDTVPDPSKAFSYDPIVAKEAQAQFLRGVVWADDPEGLLFHKPEDLSDYSSGLMWYSHFSDGSRTSASGRSARSST